MNELEIRRDISQITQEILWYKNQAGIAIIEIGNRLREAKEQLEHGQWLPWLEKEVEFSARTAQKFMKIAENYSKNETVSYLGVRKAIALLNVPEEEREEFLQDRHSMPDGSEKTAEEMTAKEMEQLIRDRDTARKLAQEQLDEASQAKLKLEAALREKSAAEEKWGRADKALAQLKAELEKKEKQLQEEKDKPIEVAVQEPSEEEKEALRKEGEEKARQDLMAKVQKAEEAKATAEAAVKEAKDRAAAAEAKLKMADKALAVFGDRFTRWQKDFSELLSAAAESEQNADKLRAALRAALKQMEAQV